MTGYTLSFCRDVEQFPRPTGLFLARKNFVIVVLKDFGKKRDCLQRHSRSLSRLATRTPNWAELPKMNGRNFSDSTTVYVDLSFNGTRNELKWLLQEISSEIQTGLHLSCLPAHQVQSQPSRGNKQLTTSPKHTEMNRERKFSFL